jgi:hypothetical protein
MCLEAWKPVMNWELSHEVSNFGRVRTLTKQKVLKSQLVEGYPSVSLCSNGKKKRAYVHHLVALAFIGLPASKIGVKSGESTINHKDFNKENNIPENLEWLTCTENYLHAYANGKVEVRAGTQLTQSKLDPCKVKRIRERLAAGESPALVARDYGVVKGTIYAIKKGITWNDGRFDSSPEI